MPDFLVSARSKLARANEHLALILKEVTEFGDRNAYSFSLEDNAEGDEISIIVHIANPPDFHYWSAIVGDCLQNLYSCLDHTIYGLAASRSWPKPPVGGTELYFPIYDDFAKFTKGLWKIGALKRDKAIVTAIEGLQPYNRPNQPFFAALTLLQHLNRIDKHRELVLVHARPKNMSFTAGGYGPKVKETKLFPGPIEDGTKIAHIGFVAPPLTMNMKIDATFFPAVNHRVMRTPAPPGATPDICGIDWLLETIRYEVTYCLDTLEKLL